MSTIRDSAALVPLVHSVADACRRICVSRTVFYQLVAAGRIRPMKVGARTLVTESELRRFVESKMQEAV